MDLFTPVAVTDLLLLWTDTGPHRPLCISHVPLMTFTVHLGATVFERDSFKECIK